MEVGKLFVAHGSDVVLIVIAIAACVYLASDGVDLLVAAFEIASIRILANRSGISAFVVGVDVLHGS